MVNGEWSMASRSLRLTYDLAPPKIIADCRLPIADCRLPIADCRLFIAHCQLIQDRYISEGK
jgi:hypothetical protein